jgi:hypothetical protein
MTGCSPHAGPPARWGSTTSHEHSFAERQHHGPLLWARASLTAGLRGFLTAGWSRRDSDGTPRPSTTDQSARGIWDESAAAWSRRRHLERDCHSTVALQPFVGARLDVSGLRSRMSATERSEPGVVGVGESDHVRTAVIQPSLYMRLSKR